ncbi:hypothetical protein [Streptomyces sp. TE33382]
MTADLGAWLVDQGLPPRVATAVEALGPQLDEAVDRTVAKVATRFVRSDRFEAIWTGANRAAHSSVVQALTGEGRGAVEVEGGTVTLDIGAAVERVKEDLVYAGLTPAERIPEVDKQMVLFQSDRLEKARSAFRLLDAVGNWLPVLTVILAAGGVLLARRRRRALVTTALCAAADCLVLSVALAVARRYYLDHLPAQVQSREAAAAVFDTLVRFLKDSVGTALVLAVVVALGAYLSGTGRLPRGVRGAVERAAGAVADRGAAHDLHTGRAGTWVRARRREVTIGVLAVIALVFALWNRPTVLTVLAFTLVLLAVLALIALLAAGGRAEDRGKAADGP